MNSVRSALATLSKNFHNEGQEIEKLKRLIETPGSGENHSLTQIAKAYVQFGEMEWQAAKRMKTSVGKMNCINRARIWFDAARYAMRKIENV